MTLTTDEPAVSRERTPREPHSDFRTSAPQPDVALAPSIMSASALAWRHELCECRAPGTRHRPFQKTFLRDEG